MMVAGPVEHADYSQVRSNGWSAREWCRVCFFYLFASPRLTSARNTTASLREICRFGETTEPPEKHAYIVRVYGICSSTFEPHKQRMLDRRYRENPAVFACSKGLRALGYARWAWTRQRDPSCMLPLANPFSSHRSHVCLRLAAASLRNIPTGRTICIPSSGRLHTQPLVVPPPEHSSVSISIWSADKN